MKKKIFLLFAAVLTLTTVLANGHAGPAYPNFNLPRVEEMMFLVLQIGIIIFAAKLGGMLASLLKMPSILGELAVGIAIGPWALGGIGFGDGLFKYGLFHGAALRYMNDAAMLSGGHEAVVHAFGTAAGNGAMFDATTPALYGIATLASIILLFLSGLETNLKMFLKYSFVGLMVGLGGVIFSFVLGDLCAVYFLPKFFPDLESSRLIVSAIPENFPELAKSLNITGSGSGLVSAMLQAAPMYMGIMSTATSVGITARILSERKKMDSEEGVSIMAGAVIDDVLGLIVLAIGNGIIAATMTHQGAAGAEGGGAGGAINWGDIGMVAVTAFGVWMGATLIGVVFARKISWLLKLFKSPQAIATLAFGLSMILAGFFEFMGLAMIIGAYVMGLALSRTDLKHMIQETLSPVYTFLVPIFFCVMGMMVDLSPLMDPEKGPALLKFGAIYTVLAVLAKMLGCAIPSWFCGFNLLGGLRIGAGMVPRGEVALIIAGLGLSQGYLSQEIFSIGIIMTLITTVVAPPCLVGLFLPKKQGVRHPKPSMKDSRQVSFQLANDSIANLVMNKLVEEFGREGFFTCCLDKTPHSCIWEVTMDDIELSLHRDGSSINVECTQEEEAVVKQAWMEVISQIYELAQSIRKPVQNQDEVKKFIESDEETKGSFSSSMISRHVSNFVMLPGFKASSKKEAIEKLVGEVCRAFPKQINDEHAIVQSVFAREESMPTGLDHGLAVPHGRTDGVKSLLGAIAIVDNSENENGIIPDWETIDHSRIQILMLMLVPETTQTPYLQLMASVCHALKSEENRELLLRCQTQTEMVKFFKEVN